MNSTNIINYYTLDQANEILFAEYEARKQKRQQVKAKRALLVYYIKQKIIGGMLVMAGILSILLFNDGTITLITIPLGIWVFFTRERVLNIRE